MTIAAKPPSPFIHSLVAESRRLMQSHRILPFGVRIRTARCPMENLGTVYMDQKRSSFLKGSHLL